ncbi:unnamed protein product [Haemonchus placei]|uniref:Uncharacterized protein n=1 Tax=Haemonchus placei TaxID=6290 RepID=A0A0N4WU82_HAEPC|nr:unnamed protein product [Haemonchus placei]
MLVDVTRPFLASRVCISAGGRGLGHRHVVAVTLPARLRYAHSFPEGYIVPNGALSSCSKSTLSYAFGTIAL